MLQKLMVLCTPLVVTAGLIALPAASSADTFYKCPRGVHNHKYCQKFKRCRVPRVEGLTKGEADWQFRHHDCRAGKVFTSRHHNRHIHRGRVINQDPSPGTVTKRSVNIELNR